VFWSDTALAMATAARTKRKTDRKKRSCEKRSSPCIDLYFLAVSVVRFAGEVRSLFLMPFLTGVPLLQFQSENVPFRITNESFSLSSQMICKIGSLCFAEKRYRVRKFISYY
jgi:hypothetical protein